METGMRNKAEEQGRDRTRMSNRRDMKSCVNDGSR